MHDLGPLSRSLALCTWRLLPCGRGTVPAAARSTPRGGTSLSPLPAPRKAESSEGWDPVSPPPPGGSSPAGLLVVEGTQSRCALRELRTAWSLSRGARACHASASEPSAGGAPRICCWGPTLSILPGQGLSIGKCPVFLSAGQMLWHMAVSLSRSVSPRTSGPTWWHYGPW